LWITTSSAAPRYTPWSAPVNLGSVVNSPDLDIGPGLSRDGKSLYFSSNRPGGYGGMDLWISKRRSEHDPWGVPVNLGPTVNSNSYEGVPSLSRDGQFLIFHGDRPGGFGVWDIWVAWRRHTRDDFGWETPVNLGIAVNTPFDDSGARLYQGDDATYLLFNSTRPGGQGFQDIYIVRLYADGSFGQVEPMDELNTPWYDNRPAIRFDGLELFLFSNRPGTYGSQDLWVSSRTSTADRWSTPLNLGPLINTVFTDFLPEIASSRRELYFASDRPGGSGGFDLYVSRRE
jgi:Tol biopolymer transport system component